MGDISKFVKQALAGALAITLSLGMVATANAGGDHQSELVRNNAPWGISVASYNSRKTETRIRRTGEVYLLRGLANIFSLGMDEIERKMRAKGLDAVTFNHSGWKYHADDIIKRSKKKNVSYPIIIAGHSLGANSAVSMANYLAKNKIKVALVVTFDPTIKRIVGKNIKTVINYYVPNGKNEVVRGRGFRGRIKNVDITDRKGVGHMNVEKNPKLQQDLINRTMKLTRKTKRRKTS